MKKVLFAMMAMMVASRMISSIDSMTAVQAYVVTDAPVTKAMADAPGNPMY